MSAAGLCVRVRLSAARALANAARRRIWRWIFAQPQRTLGSFFIDTSDHIGAERIILGDRYEAYLLAILDQVIQFLGLGKGSALDVGANIGNHACFFANRFSYVVCVEPSKVATLVLEANLLASGFRNFEIHRCALGRDASAGLLERVSNENLGSSIVLETDTEGDFQIVRGDKLWRETGVNNLELIKIDVEGAEAGVIDGLVETLADEQPLVCVEVLDEEHWADVRRTLSTAGYISWFVIVSTIEQRTTFDRMQSMLLGKAVQMVPMPDAFPAKGYEMILCMTKSHMDVFRARNANAKPDR